MSDMFFVRHQCQMCGKADDPAFVSPSEVKLLPYGWTVSDEYGTVCSECAEDLGPVDQHERKDQ